VNMRLTSRDGQGNADSLTKWWFRWSQTYIHVNSNTSLCLAAGADCELRESRVAESVSP
jgi:hypothetical protein